MASWHWSSLGQLNLKPTRPNGLVGCKVPTDLVKISVKEAMHMGFYYIPRLPLSNLMDGWQNTYQYFDACFKKFIFQSRNYVVWNLKKKIISVTENFFIQRMFWECQSDRRSTKDTPSYGASFVNTYEKIDRFILAQLCIVSDLKCGISI